MRPVKPARTFLEVCVARATDDPASVFSTLRATPKAMRVCQYVVEWAIALQDGPTRATVRDVAAYWRQAEATAYRRNRDFRELFPDEPNPGRLARELIRVQKRRRSTGDVESLMQLPIVV
jgi:ferric-dicitrate binding protein FerR (iron transport regulator)